jgi:hypothetical protein
MTDPILVPINQGAAIIGRSAMFARRHKQGYRS